MSNTYVFKRKMKRIAAAIFDLMGSMLFCARNRSFQKKPIQKILVIRPDHLGDVVMTLPAITALHKAYPTAQIDMLVDVANGPLLEDLRYIREVIPFQEHWFSRQKVGFFQALKSGCAMAGVLRKKHYDLAIDFRGDLRSILMMFFGRIPFRLAYGQTGGSFLLTQCPEKNLNDHEVLNNLRLIETLQVRGDPVLSPLTYSAAKKQVFWNQNGNIFQSHQGRRIILHPGAGYPSKMWPVENYLALIKRLVSESMAQVILIGTEQEKNLLKDLPESPLIVDLRGKTQVAELPILFDACDLYIGNDSGPAHLAAAQALESVILFSGANSAQKWRPFSDQSHLVQYSVPCSPCESRICPLHHHECMTKITVESVMAKIVTLLQKKDTNL